jgi:hypothetical protein
MSLACFELQIGTACSGEIVLKLNMADSGSEDKQDNTPLVGGEDDGNI